MIEVSALNLLPHVLFKLVQYNAKFSNPDLLRFSGSLKLKLKMQKNVFWSTKFSSAKFSALDSKNSS